MRKIAIALAALAALGLSVPMSSAVKAQEAKVVIKSGDRDRHHDRRWHRDRDHRKKVVIIKKHRDSDRKVVMVNRHRDHDRKVVVVKKHRDRNND